MSHHRKRPEAPLDQFFRSVYDSLAKKVLEESSEGGLGGTPRGALPAEEERVAKDRRSTGARKAGKPLDSKTTRPAADAPNDEPTVH